MSPDKRVPRPGRQLTPRPIDPMIAQELGVEPDPEPAGGWAPQPRKLGRGRPAKIRRGLVLLFYGRLLWRLGDSGPGRHGGYGLPPGQHAPRPRNKPYDVAKTLTVLREQWSSWEEDWQLTPRRPFPTADLEDPLAAGVSPQDIAHIVLAAWFGLDAEHMDRYITRFRGALPLDARIALGI